MIIGVDVSCWLNKRGFGRFSRDLIQALIALDQENEYLFFADKETFDQLSLPKNVTAVCVPTSDSPIQAASSTGRRSLKDIFAFSREIAKYKVDIFFFPAVYTYFPVFNRTKIVIIIYDVIANLHPEFVFPNKKAAFFWKLKQRAANFQACETITISEFSRDQILEKFKLPKSKVHVILGGANQVFAPQRDKESAGRVLESYGLGAKEKYILYVGGFSPHKNILRLVDVFHSLTKIAELADVKLVLLGDYKGDTFHSNYRDVSKKAEELNIGDKIIFTGFVPDEQLVSFYSEASLMVFPSFFEGFGLPVLEAISCGTPVAASRIGPVQEILGDSGRFFDPHDPVDMFNVIKELMLDKNQRDEMGRNGLLRAGQFNWEKAARKTLSVFEELGKKNG